MSKTYDRLMTYLNEATGQGGDDMPTETETPTPVTDTYDAIIAVVDEQIGNLTKLRYDLWQRRMEEYEQERGQ